MKSIEEIRDMLEHLGKLKPEMCSFDPGTGSPGSMGWSCM